MKEREQILSKINVYQKTLQTFVQVYENINKCILFAESINKNFDLN